MRLFVPLCLLLVATTALAQDEDLPPDEVADLVDLYVERGVESLRQGSYQEARLRFEKALKRDPKNRAAHLGVARTYQAVGAYEKASAQLAQLFAAHPADREGKVLQAEIDLVHGRTAAVEDGLRAVLAIGEEGPDLVGLRARVVLAEARAARGRKDEARNVLDEVVKRYEKRTDALARAVFDARELKDDVAVARPLAEEMTLFARALRLYVDLSPLDHNYLEAAFDLLNGAKELDEDNWERWIEYVRVTRAERTRAMARAHTAQQIADRRNPEVADLYVEIARSILTGFNSSEARSLAETALRINPNHTDARAIVARIALEDNEYDQADENLRKGLAVNPDHRELLSLQATFELLLGHEKEFEEGMKRVLAIDPTYGEGLHLAGLVVASRQRRYDRAVELVRRGLLVDPLNFQAHATLGVFLANLGRAQEALDALKKSRELFPFDHPVRENFRKVLEYVTGSMTEVKTDHFVIRFDPSEHEILSHFLPPLLEECWADMVARYDFTPKFPVLVDVFKRADDFSVRTLGIPGIPALGACFGGLITLDSPQALPPGNFLWASTARHEFAHVISLQLSGGQVPRWFTEGLSVYEERPLDTGWSREEQFERRVYDAFQTGKLPPIGTFDALFRTPQVAYAYYVGGLMLQFLVDRSGEAGIVKALRLYGEDTPMDRVFREAFGLELDQFDKEFAAFIGRRVAGYKLTPNFALILPELRAKALENPRDGETLIRLAWGYFQNRQLVDAGDYLDRALDAGMKDKPLAVLLQAHLAIGAGRLDEARPKLEAFFAAGGEDYDARMLMAGFYQRDNDDANYVDTLKKAKAAWPLRTEGRNPYAMLRSHYLARGQADLALQELAEQAAIASKNVDMRLALAREYLQRDRKDDAVRVLEEAYRVTVFDRRVHAALVPLYRERKQFEKAVLAARCVVALRTEEDSDEAVMQMWLDLAEVLVEAGRAGEAGTALEEAGKLAGDGDVPRLKELKERVAKAGQ